MSVAEIANDLVAMCRQGKNLDAIAKYYSEDIVSVESGSAPGMPAEMKGIDAITQKNKWWLDNHEIISANAIGPFLGDNQFAVEWKYEVKQKATGNNMQMDEMALYTVEGGKIVHEHFFYNMGT